MNGRKALEGHSTGPTVENEPSDPEAVAETAGQTEAEVTGVFTAGIRRHDGPDPLVPEPSGSARARSRA